LSYTGVLVGTISAATSSKLGGRNTLTGFCGFFGFFIDSQFRIVDTDPKPSPVAHAHRKQDVGVQRSTLVAHRLGQGALFEQAQTLQQTIGNWATYLTRRFSNLPAKGPAEPTRGVATADGMTAPPLVNEVLHQPGRPLDPASRVFFEPRFGHDYATATPPTAMP
jgi:hypothetical protein